MLLFLRIYVRLYPRAYGAISEVAPQQAAEWEEAGRERVCMDVSQGHLSFGVFHMPVIAANAHVAKRNQLNRDVVCYQVEEITASLVISLTQVICLLDKFDLANIGTKQGVIFTVSKTHFPSHQQLEQSLKLGSYS